MKPLRTFPGFLLQASRGESNLQQKAVSDGALKLPCGAIQGSREKFQLRSSPGLMRTEITKCPWWTHWDSNDNFSKAVWCPGPAIDQRRVDWGVCHVSIPLAGDPVVDFLTRDCAIVTRGQYPSLSKMMMPWNRMIHFVHLCPSCPPYWYNYW